MKKLLVVCACAMAAFSAASADPLSACTVLVGTYAEAGRPDQPVLTVTFTNDEFRVIDETGTKTLVRVTPTDAGLVIIENPADPNAYQLYFDTEANAYIYWHVGRARDGKPLPETAAHKKKLVKVKAPDKGKKQ